MKLYFIEQQQMEQLQELFNNKCDDEYVVLNSNGQLCDIMQYSAKYQNVHFATVPYAKLDPTMRLH